MKLRCGLDSSWSAPESLAELSLAPETDARQATLAAKTNLLIRIEHVPLGARVPTKNPRPWEYDDSLPEPDQDTWAKLSLTMVRDDGGVIDAELIRPRTRIRQHGIQAGQLLPMYIEELHVRGSVLVTAIEACPEIASGEGSVVTARFCTREVHEIVRAEILGPDGEIETLEGNAIHPIWSVDRQDWVPLGELKKGRRGQPSCASQPQVFRVVVCLLGKGDEFAKFRVKISASLPPWREQPLHGFRPSRRKAKTGSTYVRTSPYE